MPNTVLMPFRGSLASPLLLLLVFGQLPPSICDEGAPGEKGEKGSHGDKGNKGRKFQYCMEKNSSDTFYVTYIAQSSA